MLRLINNFKLLAIIESTSSPKLINYQSVRWRKPRWIPKAKSKIFKIPPRTQTPEEEKVELMRLYDNYRTCVRSIRRHLIQRYNSMYSVAADPEEQHRAFCEDFAKCVEINDKWNEEQKVLREKRVAEELEAELKSAREEIEREIIKEEERLMQIEEIVRKQKEEAKHFITPDKLDEAIELALTNPVDYNFAIDLNGEKIIGRESGPPKKDKISVSQ